MHDDPGERNGWVGFWHTHPTINDGQPSATDLRTFANQCRNLREITGELAEYVALILTPIWQDYRDSGEGRLSWAKPTVHAWHLRALSEDQFTCTRAEVVRP
jgi:hypothetical protein